MTFLKTLSSFLCCGILLYSRAGAVSEPPIESRYLEVNLSSIFPAQFIEKRTTVDNIPFQVGDKDELFSLANAGWPEWQDDPGSYVENYDSGKVSGESLIIPLVQVPKVDYASAYVLLRVDGEGPSRLTLRLGRRLAGQGAKSQVLMKDFTAEISPSKELQVVRIPLTESIAQDIADDVMDIEITKEVRLARRSPDPCRFRWRPLGPSSGIQIAALTLERSPIQMTVRAKEIGGLFEQPATPAFSVDLANVTDVPQNYELSTKGQQFQGTIPPGESISQGVTFPDLSPGWYPLSVELSTAAGKLARKTAFGVLPPDRRKFREDSPWGTWVFAAGAHFTPLSADLSGSLMRKLGLRYGMFGATADERERYGVLQGKTFSIRLRTKDPQNAAAAYAEARKIHPDRTHDALIFHEDSISGGHVTRTPDLFHDHPPYKLSEQEEERFQNLWNIAMSASKSLRESGTNIKIHLGNGPIALREELYKRGFPAELFDFGGNENPTFSRLPETQPPDQIANNASLWMDRQLLDAYGYTDKKVSQAHETLYPSTTPGNLSYQSQADYFVRNALHSLAWGMPRISLGSLTDLGNSYYHSNWGGSGLMTRQPEVAPKPAALAVATMTSMLDGATYRDFLETGSRSAYIMRFEKRDGGEVLPFWVVRGKREFRLNIANASRVRVVSPMGDQRDVPVENGSLSLTATASPNWLELPAGAAITGVTLGAPEYPDSDPQGKVSVLDSLDSLDGWKVENKPNALLEYYNPFAPRRKGSFTFEAANSAIKVTPLPISGGKPTMPMYAELTRQENIILPGKPAEIGLWVDGNSSWGRIIFELEDASGQSWISIGAKAKGGSEWMRDWVGQDLTQNYQPGEISDWNTDDAWGLSRINFDGWRYVGFPLPGQYPGEGYHWPANSQWRWDKDGIVHYPLSLKKIIVELPEKHLYLTDYSPVKRSEIFLRKLVSVEKDPDAPKTEAGDYVESAQTTIR
jgi:hypothetical protein